LNVEVREASGKPVSGVQISPSPAHCTYSRLSSQTTNAKGEARFAPLYRGVDYELTCYKEGYDFLEAELPEVASKSWSGRKQVTLRNADRSVTGVVLDKKGKPVEGAEVRLDYSWHPSVTTGSDGRF